MDEFKLLKDITWIDFASRAQMYKFLAEQFGDERSLSLLNIGKKIATGDRTILNIVKWVVEYADDKIRGNPVDVATRIVNKLDNVPVAKKPVVVESIKSVINKINKSAEKVSKKRAEDMIQAAIQKELAEKAKQEAVEATAKKVEELKNMPGAKELTRSDRLWPLKDSAGNPRYMTDKWPIEQKFFDRWVQKVQIWWKTYWMGDIKIFEMNAAKEAEKAVEQGADQLWADAKKALRKIQNSPTSKSMGSNLRAILDDLGIENVDDIPEWAEADILKMVRARKPK